MLKGASLGKKVARFFISGEGTAQLSKRHDDSAGFEAGLDALMRLHKTKKKKKALTPAAAAAAALAEVAYGNEKDTTVRPTKGTGGGGGGPSETARTELRRRRARQAEWTGPTHVKREMWKRDTVGDTKKAARTPHTMASRIAKQLDALDVRLIASVVEPR